MLKPIFLTSLVAALAAPALAQMPVPSPATPMPWVTPATTLSIVAEGKVERAPDVADFQTGVVTQAKTASDAMRQNAERMARVVAALRAAGIAERDIQTSGISLNPQYVYRNNLPPLLNGYQATNNVNVRVRDIPNMGKTIDALVAVGSNQINGPNFRLDKPEPALDEARVMAVGKARARAELYARAAGMRVKRIVQINESSSVQSPYPPQMYARAQAMDAKAESTSVSPGEVEATVSVNMVFELE